MAVGLWGEGNSTAQTGLSYIPRIFAADSEIDFFIFLSARSFSFFSFFSACVLLPCRLILILWAFLGVLRDFLLTNEDFLALTGESA